MSPAVPAVTAGTAADAGSGLSPGAGRPRVLAALVVLGVLWGGSFPLIAVAAPTLGPVAVTHARVVVALVVLAAVAGTRRRSWPALARRPGPFLLLAALNVALPLTLVATAVVAGHRPHAGRGGIGGCWGSASWSAAHRSRWTRGPCWRWPHR